MINRRLVLGRIAAATTIDASRIAFAKEKHHLTEKTFLAKESKRMASRRSIRLEKKSKSLPEVNNGKVTAVTAAGNAGEESGGLVRMLAETTPGITLASMQLAQADVYYYGYGSMTILLTTTIGSH